jgi:aspartate carbamoyltransferase catalytic subunit
MTWSGPHLLDVDELNVSDLDFILQESARLRKWIDGGGGWAGNLRGENVALLFAEPSTRTRLSFELAARRLGAETYVLEPISSSMVKGETFVDTVRNLDALGFSKLIVRHHRAGAAAVATRYFGGSVINAGDGWHAHPTQALLDLYTLADHFWDHVGSLDVREDLRGRKIAIVGDVLHSRVAKSNVWTLTCAGADVWLCGPRAWLLGLDALPATLTESLDAALRDADAVMGLRVQKERMAPGVSLDDYIARYQITEERFARAAQRAVFLHPGPINEGVEVTREVARGPRSLVLEQARNGVPVRMAVLATLAGSSVGSPERSYVGSRG